MKQNHLLRFGTALTGAALLCFAGARYVELLTLRNSANDFENIRSIVMSGHDIFAQLGAVYCYRDDTFKKFVLLGLLVGLWFLIRLVKKLDAKRFRALRRKLRRIRERRKELTAPLVPYGTSVCKASRWGVLPDTRRRYSILMQVRFREGNDYVFSAEASEKAAVMEMKGLFMMRTDGVLSRLSLPLTLIWTADGVALAGKAFRIPAEDRTASCVTVRAGDKISAVIDTVTITLFVL